MPFLLIFWLFVSSFYIGPVMAKSDSITYGYIEKATLVDQDLTISAKLDTGAKSASLNASHIREMVKNGKPYLSFLVPSRQGDKFFECEYIGKVNIKNRADENHSYKLLRKSMKRPVVLMNVRLGNKIRKIRVNLTNRKHFIYPMLLGREAILAFNGVVDPQKKYTQRST